MWDNLRKLAKATHSPPHSGESSVISVHPLLNLYEVLSFLLVIPGLFTTHGGGVFLIMLNTAAARSISRGKFILPAIIIIICNSLLAILSWFIASGSDGYMYVSLSIPTMLFLSGTSALYFESKRNKLG